MIKSLNTAWWVQRWSELWPAKTALIYEDEPAAHAESIKLAKLGAADQAKAPAADREKKKGEIMQVKTALTYLTKHKILPAEFAPLKTINQVIDEQGWNKKN